MREASSTGSTAAHTEWMKIARVDAPAPAMSRRTLLVSDETNQKCNITSARQIVKIASGAQ